MYGVHPRLLSDENPPRPLEIQITTEQHGKRIAQFHHARIEANELLLKRAINAQKVRSDLIKPEHSVFQPGQWVLVRHEGREKFQAKWYGPYYVVKAHPLGTYQLRDPDGNVLRHLINGQRFLHANIENANPMQLWSSPAMQAQLKKQNIDWAKPSPEVQLILDTDDPFPPTYEELAALTKKEWKELQRTGVRNTSVGEEEQVIPAHAQPPTNNARRSRSNTRAQQNTPTIPVLDQNTPTHTPISPPTSNQIHAAIPDHALDNALTPRITSALTRDIIQKEGVAPTINTEMPRENNKQNIYLGLRSYLNPNCIDTEFRARNCVSRQLGFSIYLKAAVFARANTFFGYQTAIAGIHMGKVLVYPYY